MLISLKSFIAGGFRYDTFAGYGPFYYEFWGRLFSIFDIPVNHDNGRLATLAVWLSSSLLIGLSTWRMTGSLVIGIATQLGTFQGLFSLVIEPMHPGGIIVLLLSAIVCFSSFVRDRDSRLTMALLGTSVMALILIKINVGIFALAALGLVCSISYPVIAQRQWIRTSVEVIFRCASTAADLFKSE